MYSAKSMPLQTEDVKCTSQTEKVICHVGYPVLRENQEVSTKPHKGKNNK